MDYVILNWNNYEITVDCISKVLAFDAQSSIILVDNGSPLSAKEKLWRHISGLGFHKVAQDTEVDNRFRRGERTLLLLELDENYGFAIGNNFGISLSYRLGSEHVIIMNNDVFINSSLTDKITKVFREDKNIALIGVNVIQKGRSINPMRVDDTMLFVFWYKLLYPILYPIIFLQKYLYRKRNRLLNMKNVIYELNGNECLSGCFLACKTSALHDVGYFDTETFLFAEELILINKIRKKGYKIIYMPEIAVIHDHSETTKKLPWQELEKHLNKSMLYYLTNYKRIGQLSIKLINIAEAVWIRIWLPIKIYINVECKLFARK
jgi:GT2 family glycosyltransferase